MGAVQSSINAETSTVAGAVVIGSIAVMATAYQFIGQKKASDVSKEKSQPQPAPSKKGKKKGTTGADDDFDKIVAAAAAENAAVAEVSKHANAVAFSDVVPGSFDATASVGAQDEDGAGASAKKDKKKSKKKAKKTANLAASASSIGADDSGVPESDPKAASGSRTLPTVISVDESIVHVPADGPSEAPRPSKGKKKKNAKAENANVSGTQTNGSTVATATPGPSSTPKPSSSTPKPKITSTTDSLDDGTWTRVSSRKNTSAPGMQQSQSLSQSEILTSDTNLTASVTGDTETSSVGSAAKPDTASEDEEVQEVKRKTFAEKMLPKRRTGVEDMEEEPLQPPIARVLRVTPGPNEKPAKGFSWGDYEDVHVPGSSSLHQPYVDGETSADADGDDDGWIVKNSRRRTKHDRTTTSNTSPTTHTPTSAPETITKRQRQNIARREAQKADKQAQEAERVAKLAKHKKELERAKIEEQWKHGAGGKKSTSGGMSASVDENGGLVWD